MRIAALAGLALVSLFAIQVVCFQKRRVVVGTAEYGVTLELPRVWERREGATCRLEQGSGRAEIACDYFAHPTAIFPGSAAESVLIAYDFDVRSELIVFQLGRSSSDQAVPPTLDRIVLSSSLPHRRATRDELKGALALVSGSADAEFRQLTIPTLDLGLIKTRVTRRNLLSQLASIERDYARLDTVAR